MPTLAIIGVIFFVLGYLIPAGIEIYDRTRHPRDSADSRVSPFSIRSDWFTAFSALTVGMAAFLIYEWTGGKISISDRELAAVIVLAASVSAFAAFALMKGLEGIAMALGYMWETVVAKRQRLAEEAEQEKVAIMKQARAEGLAEGLAEGRAEGLAEGRAEGRAEGLAEGRAELEDVHEENTRLKARLTEVEQNRNDDAK